MNQYLENWLFRGNVNLLVTIKVGIFMLISGCSSDTTRNSSAQEELTQFVVKDKTTCTIKSRQGKLTRKNIYGIWKSKIHWFKNQSDSCWTGALPVNEDCTFYLDSNNRFEIFTKFNNDSLDFVFGEFTIQPYNDLNELIFAKTKDKFSSIEIGDTASTEQYFVDFRTNGNLLIIDQIFEGDNDLGHILEMELITNANSGRKTNAGL